MIGTSSDDWKWVAVWLAFACILERQASVAPTPVRDNPLRTPVRENESGPINRLAIKTVELGEAVIGVFR